MKYLIIRCEDLAQASKHVPSLLEGSKASHLHQLAQAGSAGLVRPKNNTDGDYSGIDSLQMHRGLLGSALKDPHTLPGACYATQGDVKLRDGETAWCCELVTQRDDKIIDSTAGKITSNESAALIKTLNDQLSSDTRRWATLQNSHSLFLTTDLLFLSDGNPSIDPPEMLKGRVWTERLPKGQAGQSLQLLIEQTAKILEDHPVNQVRVDLGENPANLLWFWGAARIDSLPLKAESPRIKGLVLSSYFPMRGLAKLRNFDISETELSLDEDGCHQLNRTIKESLERYDLVYVHLVIDSSDPVERLCVINRIDQIVLKPLAVTLTQHDPVRMLFTADDRLTGLIPFIASGSGLPQQQIDKLTTEALMESPLTFEDSAALFSWFIKDSHN